MKTTITVLQAIAVKQCCLSTVYRWIKQLRINATKQNGRRNIVCDEKWQTIQKSQSRRAVIVSFKQQIQQLVQQVRELQQENGQLKTQQLEARRKHQEDYDTYEQDVIEISDIHRQEIQTYEQKLVYLENTVQKQEVMIRDKDTIIKKLYHANMGLGQALQSTVLLALTEKLLGIIVSMAYKKMGLVYANDQSQPFYN